MFSPQPTPKPIPLRLRLGTMLLDHALFCFAGMLPIFIWKFIVRPDDFTNAIPTLLMTPLFVLYFCKDCIGGRSPAKRILGLAVVNCRSGAPASSIQSVIRNLSIVIWPIEVLVAVFDQQQRIGDRLAETKLTYYYPPVNKPEFNAIELAAAVAIAALFTFLLTIPFRILFNVAL